MSLNSKLGENSLTRHTFLLLLYRHFRNVFFVSDGCVDYFAAIETARQCLMMTLLYKVTIVFHPVPPISAAFFANVAWPRFLARELVEDGAHVLVGMS